MVKRVSVALTLMFAAALLAEPFGFRSYRQSFTLKFATANEAEKAVIVPRGLPGNYELAFTSRWDDSTMSHANTFRVMKKYGAKGNFFICGNVDSNIPVIEKVIRDGCLAGSHTVNHYPSSVLCANEHFYEAMANRIGIEVLAQHPVNAYVSPYGQLFGVAGEGSESLGSALMATGLIGFCDRTEPHHIKTIGYPDDGFAFVYRIVPGDRVPDMKKFERDYAAYMSGSKLKKHPALSMSTHSWHTKEGLVLLDEIYRKLTSNKNWWNCNQNEYAAYRYEFTNAKVEKRCEGNTVEVTVTRYEPFELGADVPLTFEVRNASAVSAAGAKLFDDGRKVELAHASGHTLPEIYACNNEKHGIKDIALVLKREKNKLTATIVNKGKEALEKSALTFRLPPVCKELAVRRDISDVASGKEASVTIALEMDKSSLHYTLGSPYYAVQFDFIRGGKRCRLFADLKEAVTVPDKPRTINEAAAYFRGRKGVDLAGLSLPQTDLKAESLIPLKRRPAVCTVNTLFPGKVLDRSRRFITVVEFNSDSEKSIVIPVKLLSPKESTLWLNGKKLAARGKNKVTLLKGRNRMVFDCKTGRAGMVALPLGNGLELLKTPEL